jgi:hypothetical protein
LPARQTDLHGCAFAESAVDVNLSAMILCTSGALLEEHHFADAVESPGGEFVEVKAVVVGAVPDGVIEAGTASYKAQTTINKR